jgi:hypothetical protein
VKWRPHSCSVLGDASLTSIHDFSFGNSVEQAAVVPYPGESMFDKIMQSEHSLGPVVCSNKN